MARAGDDKDDGQEQVSEARECMACRGSGSVISNLGGTPTTVTCPWCKGSGMRIAEVDAQAGRAEQEGDGRAAEDTEVTTRPGDVAGEDDAGDGDGDDGAAA